MVSNKVDKWLWGIILKGEETGWYAGNVRHRMHTCIERFDQRLRNHKNEVILLRTHRAKDLHNSFKSIVPIIDGRMSTQKPVYHNNS